MARLRLRVEIAAFQDVIGNQRGNRSRNHLTTVGLRGPAAVLEDAPVDGVDDEVADMTGAPEALGATASDTATVAAIGGGDAEGVELGSDMRTSPAVHGEMVIDAPDHVGRGEVGPHGGVVRDEAAETTIP